MQSLFLFYRSVVVRVIMIAFVCGAVSCTTSESKRGKPQSDAVSDGAIEIDSCNICSIGSHFIVRQTSTLDGETMAISRPVAIQFFNRARLADKYQRNGGPYDSSMMKRFNMSGPGDYSALQVPKDQYFYFRGLLEPILIKNSIDVIDSVSNDRLLELQGSNGSFFVNPKEYQDQDGVLFFIPGKKPLFWTVDKEQMHCKFYDGNIVIQYFLCPTDD